MITPVEEIPTKETTTGLRKTGSRLAYVTREFPKKDNESYVRYTPVGDNHFRIVFFKIKNHSEMNVIQDHRVCRSYFVFVEKVNEQWTHKVIDGKSYF